jgi:hypothetical protein
MEVLKMISNEKDFKVTVEAKLKKIKEYNLDTAILRRRLDEFSSQNYIEREHRKYTIEDLTKNIEILEKELEEDLISSKETKIDTPIGWVDFQTMQDNWIYDIPKIMAFLKTLPEKISKKFIQVTTTLQKAELKKTIIADNTPIFENSKITDLGAKLYLSDEESEQSYEVDGVEIKRQDPKFHYKIKSDI